jgi:hypothetical protein
MNKDDYFKNGYCVVDINELFKDQDSLNIIKDTVEELAQPHNRQDYFNYRLNFEGVPYSTDSHVPVDKIQEKLREGVERNVKPTQRWYETKGYGKFAPTFNYIKESVEQYAGTIYDVKPDHYIHAQVNLTIYEDGDFIDPHSDGQNEGRFAIFLIYMSDPEKYNDGGGKLIIKDKKANIDDSVIPTFGKFVILEFTKNNINHAVEPVKNGFVRTCFLAIVSERKK